MAAFTQYHGRDLDLFEFNFVQINELSSMISPAKLLYNITKFLCVQRACYFLCDTMNFLATIAFSLCLFFFVKVDFHYGNTMTIVTCETVI